MANRKTNSGGSWRKERASTTKKNLRSRSNKYRPHPADMDKRPARGTTARYWRGGYTRRDGTKVKGHYVNKPS